MDLYPTILEMTGIDGGDDKALDGVSLVPLLRNTGGLADRALYWHYPHYQHYQQEGTTPYGAIRRGDWRLIEFYDDHRIELYNLREDPGERNNLAASSPNVAKDLQDELHQWLRATDAQMPALNPQYDPTQPEHTPSARKPEARPLKAMHAPAASKRLRTLHDITESLSMYGNLV
jgi:arylsulfatase A-like enzyme